MRTHLLSHTLIVLALASSPVMAASNLVSKDGAPVVTKDAAPSQSDAMQMTPEEEALLKNMAAEEAAMSGEMTAEESAATEEMPAEETTAAEEMPAEETTAAEEMPAEETTAAEEMSAEETTAAEEMAAEETTAAEEVPVEETTTVTTGTVIDRRGPAAPVANIDMPVRGMHMQQVEQRYGKPMGINPPVGDPPITRWDYPGFAVYFEYSYVIQSVEK